MRVRRVVGIGTASSRIALATAAPGTDYGAVTAPTKNGRSVYAPRPFTNARGYLAQAGKE